MKFNKIITIAAAFAMAMAACQPIENIYTPDTNDVSFAESNGSYELTGADIVVPVVRGVADEALSLKVDLVDTSAVYTMKSSTIDFKAGEYETTVVLTYDVETMKPTVNYGFVLSFSNADASPVGSFQFEGKAMMPLEYEDYGTISINYCYVSTLLPAKQFNLKKAKFTTNYYMIENLYGSNCNLEFFVDGDHFNVISTPKANKWLSTPAIEVASAANHPSYGQMTGWLDPDPEYCLTDGIGPENSLVVGSAIGFDIYWTVSAGYFGWKSEVLVVTDVK